MSRWGERERSPRDGAPALPHRLLQRSQHHDARTEGHPGQGRSAGTGQAPDGRKQPCWRNRAYRFEDSRSGDCVARHLAGFTSILQVDGYAAYTQLAKAKAGSDEVMALAGCWAHLRRRFYELHIKGSSQIATQTITTMAELWKIEEEIRGRDPAGRLTARRDRSAAIAADLFTLWETELPRISGKSKTGRGDPLRHVPTRGSWALPARRSCRNRFQHCRTGHQTPNNNAKECALRG